MQLNYGGLIVCHHLNRVGAGPMHLEGTMLCDAEVHSTLADAEKHRNALMISTSLEICSCPEAQFLTVRWKIQLCYSFLMLNSSILQRGSSEHAGPAAQPKLIEVQQFSEVWLCAHIIQKTSGSAQTVSAASWLTARLHYWDESCWEPWPTALRALQSIWMPATQCCKWARTDVLDRGQITINASQGRWFVTHPLVNAHLFGAQLIYLK